MRVRTIFFDMDGTLWAPHSVVLPAYRRVFAELAQPVPQESVLLDTLGYQNQEIWPRLLPQADAATLDLAVELMEQAEHELIISGVGRTFPGVAETLQTLRGDGCELYILSNCGTKYLETVPNALGIGDFFSDRFCAGAFPGKSKSQIMATVLPGMSLPGAMVGDRWHDIRAGKENGLFTVGCTYGMGKAGELADADCLIASFPELLTVLA